MDLRSYTRLLLRRWPWFLLTTVVVAALLGGASFLITPVYTATAKVVFTARVTAESTPDERRASAQWLEGRVQNYAEVVTTSDVLRPVIRQLRLDVTEPALANETTVEIPSGTQVITVSVNWTSADGAAAIANEIVGELPDVVAQIEGADSAETSPVVVESIQTALEPENRTSPNIKLNLAVALLIGLFAGILVAVLRDGFDTRVRRGRDITPLHVPYLGGVRTVRDKGGRDRLTFLKQKSEVAAVYRRIGVDTLFAAGETPAAVLYTSVKAAAGKTTLAANVAGALAEAGNRVVYIDADVRGGRLAAQAGIPQTRGITDLVAGRVGLEDALFYWKSGDFTVIPCGAKSVDLEEMLAGEKMAEVIEELGELFDVIIVDAPPVTNSSEAARFTQNFSKVVLVAEAAETKRPELARAVASLQQAGAKVLGVVLSRVAKAEEAAPAEEQTPDPDTVEAR